MAHKIIGDNGDNLIQGDDRQDAFFGRGGNDTLNGAGGDDTLLGQGGDDQLDGGDGDDVLYAATAVGGDLGHNTLEGGLGNDRLYAGAYDRADGGAGDDYVNGIGGGTGVYTGGEGSDKLALQFTSAAAYHGDLSFLADETAGATLTLEGVTASGFEGGGVALGAGADEVKLARVVSGWSVSGGAGSDTIAGNGGADTLEGGTGDDTVRGLGGDDLLMNRGAAGEHDLLEGGAGADRLWGGSAFSTLDGGAGADTISGGSAGDTLLGGSGDDLLSGSPGSYGQALVEGGDGADTLIGGYGADTLQGGAGHDVYRYDLNFAFRYGVDLIQDSDGDLVVDFSAISPNRNHPDAPFVVVDAFDGGSGEVTIHYDASDGMTHVQLDVDKDMKADLTILIQGDHTDLNQYVL